MPHCRFRNVKCWNVWNCVGPCICVWMCLGVGVHTWMCVRMCLGVCVCVWVCACAMHWYECCMQLWGYACVRLYMFVGMLCGCACMCICTRTYGLTLMYPLVMNGHALAYNTIPNVCIIGLTHVWGPLQSSSHTIHNVRLSTLALIFILYANETLAIALHSCIIPRNCPIPYSKNGDHCLLGEICVSVWQDTGTYFT